jgi:putative modified peptide
MTSPDIDTLLDKLTNDNDFRERLLGDPVGTLGSLGITVDPAAIPAVRSLPSQASLKADSSAAKAHLSSNVGMWPFVLSGKI